MKRWLSPLLIILSSWKPGFSGPPLSAESRLVRAAFVALKAHPASAQAQWGYLQAFPKSREKFLRIFMDEPKSGQLYDGHDYVEALRRLGTTYPTKVLAICFDVERKMARTSDAVAYIADVTVSVGIAHPRIFAEGAKRLTGTDQAALCRFLADEEGIEDDQQYDELAKKLGQIGATGLSTKLHQAKGWRMKQPND